MTKRTITERMEEDPVFYEKFSKLIEKAIEDYRQQRISELQFLNHVNDIRDQVVRPAHEDVPEVVRGDPLAVSFFHTIEKAFGSVTGADVGERRDAASETAIRFAEIIMGHSVVNWQANINAQNAMRNDMDDYLFDEVRNKRGIQLAPAMMDDIIETILQSARQKLAS